MTTLNRADRVDGEGRARAGSQLQTQIWVNHHGGELSERVAEAVGDDALWPEQIEWRAPLEESGFAEPLDGQFLEATGLERHQDELAGVWPSSGPRWDALAVAHSSLNEPGVLLVEAKSYPDEVRGPGLSATADRSVRMILEALGWAKGLLRAERTAAWTGDYYQYANRLAHLCFLRYQLGVPAWLVNLCFTDDPHEATSAEEWQAELPRIKQELGFRSGRIPYTVDVLLPAREN